MATRAPSVRWPISPHAVDLAAGPVGRREPHSPLTVLAGVLIVGGAVLGNLSGRRAWAVSCSPTTAVLANPRRWPDLQLRGPPRPCRLRLIGAHSTAREPCFTLLAGGFRAIRYCRAANASF